jgi:hypothetical protein
MGHVSPFLWELVTTVKVEKCDSDISISDVMMKLKDKEKQTKVFSDQNLGDINCIL